MWRQIRDPDYPPRRAQDLPDDDRPQPDRPGLRQDLVDRAPAGVRRRPRPSRPRRRSTYQLDAIDRMPYDASFVPPDDALVAAALAERLLDPARQARLRRAALRPGRRRAPRLDPGRASPARTAPRSSSAARRRRSASASTASTPTTASTTSCSTGSRTSPPRRRSTARSSPAAARRAPRSRSTALADDMLKLYYEDFVAQWDGFLHDVTLAPLTDLPTATEQPQGPLQRRFRAEAPADRGGGRDRPRPARGQRRGRRRRPAEGPLQGPRQARQARQARQEGREVRPRRRGRRAPRHHRPGGVRPLQAAPGARSPRSTASRRRSTPWWRR